MAGIEVATGEGMVGRADDSKSVVNAVVMPDRTSWLVERNSVLWGTEWFCGGTERWTKDANKAIHFPCQESLCEVWDALGKGESKPLPYDEEGIDWVYSYSATEHVFCESTK